MNLGFDLDLSDIGLLDKDLSNADSNFLETDIDSFPLNILSVFKTSGRRPQNISWTLLENMSWRHLQCNNFSCSKKS